MARDRESHDSTDDKAICPFGVSSSDDDYEPGRSIVVDWESAKVDGCMREAADKRAREAQLSTLQENFMRVQNALMVA